MSRSVLVAVVKSLVFAAAAGSIALGRTVVPGETASPSDRELVDGDRQIGEAGCVSCHSVGAHAPAWILPLEAPVLAEVGRRVTPQSLRRYLAAPREEHPGTRMPDLMAGVAAGERDVAIDELVHYLASLGGPMDQTAVEADAGAVAAGEALYHRVGCVACHGPLAPPVGETAIPDGAPVRKALPRLAARTTVPELASFLLDPRRHRPAGRMPSLNLDEDEARQLAAYLLREQDAHADGPPQRFPGLRYDYYEDTIDASEPNFQDFEPVRSGSTPTFTLDPPHRDDFFGFVYSGLVSIPTAGTWQFFTNSDDGSRLSIDGETLVKNDEVHPMTEVGGAVELSAGDHAIRVTLFEHAGGEGLVVSWQGPGVDKQEIPAEALFHEARTLRPVGAEEFTVDAGKAMRGKQRFQAIGCAACHATDTPKQRPDGVPPLAAVKPAAGCLADTPQPGVPHYTFEPAQRAAVLAALKRSERWKGRPAPAEVLDRRLAALNCTACHQRGDQGGPTEANDHYFTMATDADIGDEGRVPPPLHDAGRKLRPEWMREVLLNGGAVRPYMFTRMPQFGEDNVAPLLALFPAVDRADREAAEPEFSVERVEAGRALMGLKGLSCINCHSFQGHASLGMPGPDLAAVHERLEFAWFLDFLTRPSALRPGTRMPSFYEEELADLDVLDRDKGRQIEALWTYLSMGDSAPLPSGIQVDDSGYDVVPVEEPRLVGVFMEGLSAKVLAVGFPERAHYAFDSAHLRLARLWRGDFLNAKGTWYGRAGALEVPPGDDVLDLPPGPPFAVLGDGQPWPADGRDETMRKLGLRLDSQRRPVHRYQLGEVTVEETPYPVLRQGGSWMIRQFRLHAPARPRGLTFRAAVGDTVQSKGREWQVDGVTLRFSDGVEPYVRPGKPPELRVDLDGAGSGGRGAWMMDFQVEITW